MLSENIKKLRKAKGISQEELAIKLNVVRQTLSKWENGLSVPDSDILIALAEELDTSVSTLLGEKVTESPADDLKAISEKLEIINLQLAKRKESKIKIIRRVLIVLCVLTAAIFIALVAINGSYMNWDYNDPELAIAGTMLHGFEFLFVRLAPIALAVFVIGIRIIQRLTAKSKRNSKQNKSALQSKPPVKTGGFHKGYMPIMTIYASRRGSSLWCARHGQ